MPCRYDNFHHTFCTTGELKTATDQLCKEVSTQLPEDEFLSTETGIAKSESDTITTLEGRSQASEFTELIEASDKKRDTIIRVIDRQLANMVDMAEFDPEAAEAAKKVQKLMGDNTVKTRAGYTEESAQINTLLVNARTSEYSDAIQETVEQLFSKLAAEQSNFEELIAKQAQANSEVPTGEVKTHVVSMMYRVDGILSYLERKAESHGGAYETAAANVEAMLDKIMVPARARATRRAAEQVAELITE